MALNLTNFNYALKEMYADGVGYVDELDTPTLSMLPKRTDFTGNKYVQPTQYANNAGRSGDITVAQSASNGAAGARFEITCAQDYGVIRIDGQTLRASGGGQMSRSEARSFLEARAEEIRTTTEALMQSLSHSIFRDGSGVRGTRASLAGNIVTLTNPSDALFFEVGMVVGAAITGGGAARVGTTTVAAVSRGMGAGATSTVTLTSAAAIAAFADTDNLFVSGDYVTQNRRVFGFGSWVPSTAPTATPFNGVDRSVDVSRLGGLRYTGTEMLVERLINAEAWANIQGAKIDYFVLHPSVLAQVKNILGDKIRYVDAKSFSGRVSFKTVEIDTQFGTVRLLGDRFCPVSVAYGLQMNTWKLVSRGPCPGPLDHLGSGEFFTVTTADQIEGRLGYYADLACNAPGYNIVVPTT